MPALAALSYTAEELGLFEPMLITAPTSVHEHVIDRPSPLEGHLVAIFRGWATATIRSRRHVSADSLGRAVNWGTYLFGAHSFAVFEGPARMRNRFIAAPTARTVRMRDDAPIGNVELAGTPASFFSQPRIWQYERVDSTGRRYILRALVTPDEQVLFPDVSIAALYLRELNALPEALQAVGTDQLRFYSFLPVTEVLDGRTPAELDDEELASAAAAFADLDVKAFELLPPGVQGKTLALEILIRNLGLLTDRRQEVAIVEVFKSFHDLPQLKASMADLRSRNQDLHARLFNRIDEEFFSLLEVVGERFGTQGPLTLTEFTGLVADLVRAEVQKELRDVVPLPSDPDDPVYAADEINELTIMASTLLSTLRKVLEGLVELITEPQRVVEALGQLVKLLELVGLALRDDPNAKQYLAGLVDTMHKKVVYAMRGADVLGIEMTLFMKLKWMIIWEALTWLVGGYGAIQKGRKLVDRAAVFLRIVRIAKPALSQGDFLKVTGRFRRLARAILDVPSGLDFPGEEDDMLRMLAYLPDADLEDLAQLDAAKDLAGVTRWIDLQAAAPNLAARAQQLTGRLEALLRIERSAGRFSDDLVSALNRLSKHERFTATDFDNLLQALARDAAPNAQPRASLERFARAVQALPDSAFSGSNALKLPFFRNLANSPGASDFLASSGWQAFVNLYRKADHRFDRLERLLEALARKSQSVPEAERAQRYQELIAAIAGNDQAALDSLDAWVARKPGKKRRGLGRLPKGQERARILAAADIKEFDRLTQGVEPTERGSLFEAWLRPQLKDLMKKDGNYQRVRIYLADNPQLADYVDDEVVEIDWDGRKYFECDAFWAETADAPHVLFDAKAYYAERGGRLDRAQLYAYDAAARARKVKARIGGVDKEITIQNAGYIFPNRQAAIRRLPELDNTGVEVWFFDENGDFQLLNR